MSLQMTIFNKMKMTKFAKMVDKGKGEIAHYKHSTKNVGFIGKKLSNYMYFLQRNFCCLNSTF